MDIEEYDNTYISARYGRARRKINFNDVPVHLKLSDNWDTLVLESGARNWDYLCVRDFALLIWLGT